MSRPGGLSKPCEWCGQTLRVVSAKRLLAGKVTAHVFAECDCGVSMVRPHKHEREELIRLNRH
jgi:hypothetical protein